MFSIMGCVVWAARLDFDVTLTEAALEATAAPGVLASPEVWLDEVSVALLLLPLSLGLTLLMPLGLLLLMPPGPELLLLPLELLLLLETSSEVVGDAPAPDDETGSGLEDSDEGAGSSEVEGVEEADEGTAADGDVSASEVDDEAESEFEVEVADEVEGSGAASEVEEDGAGEADDADDADEEVEPPSRQLESLDFSTATPCLYLNSPVERSLTWKIRESEPAGTLTFQVVESPWIPLMVSRVFDPT